MSQKVAFEEKLVETIKTSANPRMEFFLQNFMEGIYQNIRNNYVAKNQVAVPTKVEQPIVEESVFEAESDEEIDDAFSLFD